MARAHSPIAAGVLLAMASALSFGLTTPFIARVGHGVAPLSTASLLYGGAAALSLVSRAFGKPSGRPLTRAALPRLVLVAFFGAALAPTLLVWGLSRAGATASSLALNFEALFTVLLARLVFGEHIGRRVAVAALLMLAGGLLVGLDLGRGLEPTQLLGLLAVLGATASWALDNTATRSLSEENPVDIVAAKGALGGAATGCLAFALGEPPPSLARALGLFLCGATGYGLSLRFYLLAQRRVGAARTGSLFATGPFLGAAFAWLLGDRQATLATGLAAVAFGVAVLLHLTERHAHRHRHPAVEHEHAHRHDDGHHDHRHESAVLGEHTHPHRHEPTEHEHDHAPDIHHDHEH